MTAELPEQINLNDPDHTIHFQYFETPYKIKKFMDALGIVNFVFAYKLSTIPNPDPTIFKIGRHTGNDNVLYRSGAHIPGWGDNYHVGSSGSFMSKSIIPKLRKAYDNLYVHKNDVSVDVWNTTQMLSKTFNGSPTQEAEHKIMKDFVELYGTKPIGNFRNILNCKKATGPSTVEFNNLFELV